MEFFKALSTISESIDLTIRIKIKDGQYTLSVLPDSTEKITPLIINGTPDELDEQFIQVITSPLLETTGIIKNLNEHKKQLEEKVDEVTSTKNKDKGKKNKEEKTDKKAKEAKPETETEKETAPTLF